MSQHATQHLTLSIAGMSCGHCVGAVKTALQEVPGLTVEQVAIGNATVSFTPDATPADDITRAVQEAVHEAGYEATVKS